MVRRGTLLAYLVGAGVAGTILVVPILLREAAIERFLPGRTVPLGPALLLPVMWGVWNVLWARQQARIAVGTWGALLGLALALIVNLHLAALGAWFGAAALLVVFLPLVYYLLWHLVVGPLNEALGVGA